VAARAQFVQLHVATIDPESAQRRLLIRIDFEVDGGRRCAPA
jgi:hypothetical protein